MIKPSECWRFVEALEDKGYFEEEIVQHLLTEHRAIRRTFSERICQDREAAREIVEQAHMAARVTPPPLPFVYALEETEGSITLIMEQVEGRPLDQLIQDKMFTKPKAWALYAARIADALVVLRESGACFEKLDVEHLVLTKADTFRIRQRWPIGRPAASRIDRSPLLQRMARQPRGGVYAAGIGSALEREETEALAVILIRMHLGLSATLDQFQASIRKAGETVLDKASPAVLILGILNGMNGQGSLTSLRAIRDRLWEFHAEESARLQTELLRQKTEAEAPRPPDPAPASPAFDPFSFNVPGTASPTREAAPRPSSSTPLPRPAEGPEGGHINPFAAPGVPAPAPRKAPPAAPAGTAVDENAANPWLAGPGAAPGGGGASAGAGGSAPSVLVPLGKAAPRSSGRGIPGWLIGLMAVAALAGVGYGLSGFLTSGKPNQKPTAAIAPLAKTEFSTSEVFSLSAGPSSDPDGNPLSYEWQIVKPESLTAIFTEAGSDRPREGRLFSTKVPDIRLQFLAGAPEVTLQLIVFDGTNRSDPKTVTFAVR